ncbi:MAG: gamma-glutamyltransferase [Acidobacteriota bacterium]
MRNTCPRLGLGLIFLTVLFAQERSQSGLEFEGARPMISEPERSAHAMIASAHELATEVGLGILRRGGNAVDAAVAVCFALAVVHPEAGNLGGGGYMLVRMSDGRVRAFDYKETVPLAARLTSFPDSQRAYVGYKTAGVPGTVAGLALAHERFGRLPWAVVLEPARLLAERGFPASQRMEIVLRLQVPVMKDYPEAAKVFLHGSDKPLKQGELVKQPDLAATIERLRKFGPREFYEGETARLIAADMKAGGGFITLDDLKQYQAIGREPLRGTYRGYQVLTMPPSSSGGFVLLEMLNTLQRFPMELGMEGSAHSRHLLVEAMRRGFRDRLLYSADPAETEVPLDKLLSESYADRQAESVRQDDRITPLRELEPVETADWVESPHTTHFSVVDAEGNMVSNTYTLGNFYGSQVIPKGTGVLLGDMVGAMASSEKADAGRPRLNPLKGGTRLVSTMAPTIVMRPDGSPWLALGTPGGVTIPSTLLQVLVNLIDYKMPLRDAIEYPRIHDQFPQDRIEAEPGAIVRDVAEKLLEFGYRLNPRLRSQGDVHAVAIEPKTGMRQGWSDGRRGGHAKGY